MIRLSYQGANIMILNDLQHFSKKFIIFFKPFRFNRVLTHITIKFRKMKKFSLKGKTVLFLMVIGLLLNACADDESVNDETQTQDYSEVLLSSEADKATTAMDDITLDVYDTQEMGESSRMNSTFNNLPDCVTLTLVAEQNFRELTLDFGTEGCMVHGNILKGVMVLSWERNPEAMQVLITQTLDGFYFNNKNIQGGKTILREFSNDSGNPQSTHNIDYTIIWPNGAEASREGMVVREWIEGFGSGVWGDNVFEITGDWTTTFVNGNSHTYEVDIPLRREVVCFYFVSGSVDVERTNFSGVLDYGDGECDNQATFTFSNGTVIDIIL